MAILNTQPTMRPSVPWFGARKLARTLLDEIEAVRAERDGLRDELTRLGGLTVLQLEAKRAELESAIAEQANRLEQERKAAAAALNDVKAQRDEARKTIVVTEDVALLQEAGVYEYRHPLTDAAAYEQKLEAIQEEIKAMTRKDGGAVLAASGWTVNGSAAQGRTMIRDYSKLMLRAFNAEADNLVRTLKPYKVAAAVERLAKSRRRSSVSARQCRYAYRRRTSSCVCASSS
jgi:hypothetical protein